MHFKILDLVLILIKTKCYFYAKCTLPNFLYYGKCHLCKISQEKVFTLKHRLHGLFINVTFSPLPLCLKGVVEGDLAAVEAYKSSGGDIARQLTSDEVRLLNRPSAFDDGFTLVHLAIRFQRQDMLAVLLTEVSSDYQMVALSGITCPRYWPKEVYLILFTLWPHTRLYHFKHIRSWDIIDQCGSFCAKNANFKPFLSH